MNPDVVKYLLDIKTSIDSIEDFIGEKKDFTLYQNNKQLRRAVERELEIIGEALNRILKIDATIEIENSRRIVDLRNWVIHAYDKVDDYIIWGVLVVHLPKLKIEIEKLLKDIDFYN
ncbi:MAG TPA: DUF86 domain-containing protein [Chitinophagales bacterium]|jgi:uncharacterized protein with HEPN domain|nr:DUF86 domain-containing protein [Chitinophagales bacterium]HPN18062.1 DUF86 domain-containing protein [Chitinophagales bacterium]